MRKYKNEKNHDIIEDKTDEMDDVHLDIDELDEILDDFEPSNITPKHTPKQKKKRRLLLIIFCVLLPMSIRTMLNSSLMRTSSSGRISCLKSTEKRKKFMNTGHRFPMPPTMMLSIMSR